VHCLLIRILLSRKGASRLPVLQECSRQEKPCFRRNHYAIQGYQVFLVAQLGVCPFDQSVIPGILRLHAEGNASCTKSTAQDSVTVGTGYEDRG